MADTPTHVDVRLGADLSVIRPGDTVLVRMHRDIPLVQAHTVAERLRDRLPDVEVIVLTGADAIAVYRPDPPG